MEPSKNVEPASELLTLTKDVVQRLEASGMLADLATIRKGLEKEGLPLSERMTLAALEEAADSSLIERTAEGTYSASSSLDGLYMVTGLSPPPAHLDVTLEEPPSPAAVKTPRALDFGGGQISFPSRSRTIVAHLSVRVLKLINCAKRWEGSRCCVVWKWGSKERNHGESDVFTISKGCAMVMHNFEVMSTFIQELPAKTTEANRMLLALMLVRPDGKREQICARPIDMAQFNRDRCEKTKAFAMDKAAQPPMSLLLAVETTWVKIDGRRVATEISNSAAAAQPGDSLPLASPTAFPGVAPRTNVARAKMMSPVVMHQAMKEGQRAKVLESAKHANPTLEKMMESERHLIQKRSPGPVKSAPESNSNNNNNNLVAVPKKKHLLSPRSAAASPPGNGSPFFRRKDRSAAAVPVAVAVPSASKERPETAIFEVPLAQTMAAQRESHAGMVVPYVVHHLCCKVMQLNGQRSEGIFRISINSDDVELYSKRFDGGDYSLPLKDPNYPAVLLKHYLRKLPEPLCPDYAACIAAAEDDERVAQVFRALPTHNQHLLRYLANFICKLGHPDHVVHTRMEVPALCIVFIPATLKNPVFDYASAILNVGIEQAFMTRLVLWIRATYPDDHVAKNPYKRTRTLRRVPPPPVLEAHPQPPPGLKKRGSSMSMENLVKQSEQDTTKSRKGSNEASPQGTIRKENRAKH